MPSIYVHNYFAKDIQSKLNKEKNIKKINDPKYFYIFAQSFDNLFYYNFYKPTNGKLYRHLGHYAHVHKVSKFFTNLVVYIKENNLYDDENIGMLYGFLSHYALDSTAHPYIHYVSGRFSKSNKKKTKKYKGNHAINEIMLDSIYYYKDHSEKYYKYKLYDDLIPNMEFSSTLKSTIDYTFKHTFNVDNIGVIYNKAYNHSRKAYKYLMYDRFNIKKLLYHVVDFIYPFKRFKAYSYSHHINHIDNTILNEGHKIWLHPVTGEEHTESFYDLYDISMKKVLKYINKCNEYFNDKCSLEELKKVIGNISYSSGLDCEIRANFQYFSY